MVRYSRRVRQVGCLGKTESVDQRGIRFARGGDPLCSIDGNSGGCVIKFTKKVIVLA